MQDTVPVSLKANTSQLTVALLETLMALLMTSDGVTVATVHAFVKLGAVEQFSRFACQGVAPDCLEALDVLVGDGSVWVEESAAHGVVAAAGAHEAARVEVSSPGRDTAEEAAVGTKDRPASTEGPALPAPALKGAFGGDEELVSEVAPGLPAVKDKFKDGVVDKEETAAGAGVAVEACVPSVGSISGAGDEVVPCTAMPPLDEHVSAVAVVAAAAAAPSLDGKAGGVSVEKGASARGDPVKAVLEPRAESGSSDEDGGEVGSGSEDDDADGASQLSASEDLEELGPVADAGVGLPAATVGPPLEGGGMDDLPGLQPHASEVCYIGAVFLEKLAGHPAAGLASFSKSVVRHLAGAIRQAALGLKDSEHDPDAHTLGSRHDKFVLTTQAAARALGQYMQHKVRSSGSLLSVGCACCTEATLLISLMSRAPVYHPLPWACDRALLTRIGKRFASPWWTVASCTTYAPCLTRCGSFGRRTYCGQPSCASGQLLWGRTKPTQMPSKRTGCVLCFVCILCHRPHVSLSVRVGYRVLVCGYGSLTCSMVPLVCTLVSRAPR
jgi:hypothetical protein